MGLIGRPRVQNLRVSARGVGVRSHAEVLHAVGDLRLRLVFGVKRGIVSYSVAAPLGLDLYSLLLVHFIAEREAAARGFTGLDWRAVSFEFLTDFGGLRLEGVQIATFEGLTGYLEKFYNRPGVRREARGSGRRGVGMGELEALLDGSLQRFELVGEVRALREEVKGLTRAQKWINRHVQTFLEDYSKRRPKK